MNKFRVLNVIIICSLAVPSYAQEIPTVTDRATVSQLVHDNKVLARSIQDQKRALEHDAHMFSRPDQYGQLTDILNSYQDFIDRKGNLPQDKRRALDQIVDASAEVGHIRERGIGNVSNTTPSDNSIPLNDASIQDALDQNQQLLDNQAALLKEKNDQINDFKNQLGRIKDQLARNNDRHAAQLREIPKPIVKEVPVKEIVYKDNPSLSKALNEKSKELDDIKQKLAGFKDQLARNNKRYQEAVKDSKSVERNSKLDQAGNRRLQDENKKLQDDLRLLKEENVRNIRQAQQAAKEAAVAKALAQRNLINDKSRQLENYKDELNDLKTRLADAHKRLDESNKVAYKKQKEEAFEREQAAQLQKAIDQKASKIEDLATENAALAKTVRDLKDAVARKEKAPTPEELQRAINDRDDKNQQLERNARELNALKGQLVEANRRADQLARQASSRSVVEEQLNKAQTADLEKAINQKSAEIQNLAEENRNLQNKVRDLQDDLARKDGDQTPQQLQLALEESKGKDRQLDAYKEELAKLKDQFDAISKRAVVATPKVVDAQLDQAQVGRLQEALDRKAAQVNDLIDQNKRLSSTVNALQDAVAKNESKSSPKQLQQVLADREDILRNKNDLLSEKASQSERLKDELSRIKAELSKTNDRYDAAVKEYRDKTRNASLDAQESSRLARELAQKTAQIGDLSVTNQELANTINALKDNKAQLADLEKQLNQKDEQIALLKTELAHALEQNTLLHQQLDQEDIDLHQIRDKAEAFRKKYLEQLGMVEDKERDIKRLNEQIAQMPKSEEYQAQIGNLKGQIAVAQEQVKNVREELAGTEKALAASKEQLNLKNARLAELEAKAADNFKITGNAGEVDAIARQLSAAQAQIADLQGQLRKDDEAFASIKNKGLELKDKIAVLNESVASKNAEISQLKTDLEKVSRAPLSTDTKSQSLQKEDLKQQIETMAKASLTPQEQAQFDNLKKQYEIVVQNPVKNGKGIDPAIEELKRHYEIVVKSPQEIAQMIKENRVPSSGDVVIEKSADNAQGQDQLVELRRQAKELRDQLNQIRAEQKVSAVAGPVSDDIHNKLHAKEQESQELRDQIAKAQDQARQLRAQLTQTTQELSENKAALNAKDAHLGDLQPKVADLQAQLKKDDEAFAIIKGKGLELKDKIVSLQNDVALKDAQIAALKLDLSQSLDAQALKDNDVKQQAQHAEDLRKQLEKMAKATLTPQEQVEFDKLKKQYEIIVQNPVKNGSNINPETEELKRHYEIVVKSPQEIAQIIKENRSEIKNDSKDVASSQMTAELESLRAEAKLLRDELVKLKQTQTANVNSVPVVKQDELQAARDEAKSLREQIAQLKEVQLARTDKGKVDLMQRQLELAKSETSDLKEQISRLKAAQANAVDRTAFEELKKQYAMAVKIPAKEIVKVVPADTKVIEQQLKATTLQAQSLKEENAVLSAAKDQAIAASQAKYNDLKNQLSASQDQYNALKAEILKNREVITAKQDQSIVMQTTIKEQLGKISDSNGVIKQKDERLILQSTLQAKQRQHIDLLLKKNQLIADYQNALVSRLNAYKQKFNGAASDWAVSQQDYAKKLSEFKASIDTMDKNNIQLNDELKRMKKEKDDAYQLMDRFKERLKETADVNEDQSKELNKYRQRSDLLENSLRKMQEDMIGSDTTLVQTQEQLGRLKSANTQMLQEVQVKDLSLAMTQSSMQAKTKVLQTLVDGLKDQIKLSDAQLAVLRQQLTDAQAKVVQAERHEDLTRLKEMLKVSREEIIQINNLLRNKEVQIAKLQKELQDNSIDFSAQHKAIEALKIDMEKQQKTIAKLNEDIDWKNKENTRLKIQLKEKKINLLPTSLQSVELVIAKDREQIAVLTEQLKAAKAKINAVAAPKVSDPQGLRRALDDAREQIATLKGKLHQKLQGLVKNDPSVIGMNKEIQSLRQSLTDVIKENAGLKDKNEVMFYQIQEMQDELGKCQQQIETLPKTLK